MEENRQTQLQFERQLQDLHQQLPPTVSADTTAGVILAMLSTGGFGFGESLSSAAEWPAMQYVDFDDFSYDSMEMDLGSYRGWAETLFVSQFDHEDETHTY